MSITTIFDFVDPTDYTLNNVGFSGGLASLALVANPAQTFSQPFSSTVGFTYDPSKTSISAGVLSQIDLRPTNATFFASYASTIDANWGSGSLTATNNGATLGTNVLQLLGGVSTKYVDYSANGNAQSTQTGCVRLIYIPNYSGTPSTYQLIYRASQAVGSENNLVAFFHNITGNLSLRLFNSSGASIISADFGAFSPTAGTRYELELNWDITTGATRLFVNGVQSGSTFTQTGTRSSNISLIRIGEDSIILGAQGYANFSITDIVIFSTVQHTSNYSAPSPLPSSVAYAADTITLPAFNYSGQGSVIAFSNFTTVNDVNTPGYIMNGQYWNGTAWVSSNGTYAQTNTKAVVNAHIATLPNNNTLVIKVVTQDSTSATSITGPLVVTYAGQIYSSGTILSNSGLMVQTLLSFASVLTETGSDTVTFALQVNAVLMYWDGMSWATSDGTFAQTNTAATLLANVNTLLTVNSIVKLYILLVSGTGATSPSVDSVTIVYNFGQLAPSAPLTTIVYGFLSDIQGLPVAGATITFALINTVANAYMEGADHILIPGTVVATTDQNGYFEQAVIATTQFEGTTTFIKVTIQSGDVTENVTSARGPLYIAVPVQANIDITTLLTA